MTDYAWFPLGTATTPYTWNAVGNWNDGAYWANASDITDPPSTGTVPGPGDSAYIVAANSIIAPPSPYPAPPYPVTVDVDESDVTIATLGLGSFTVFATPYFPTVAITSVTLDVTSAIVASFSADFPSPIGDQGFSGGGTITLASAAGLTVGTTVDPDVVVDFTDRTADRLTLQGVSASDDTAFDGTIDGFGVNNVIDLSSIALAGVTKNYSGGILTLSVGSTPVAVLQIAGSFNTNSFQLQDDGTGHVEIIVCFASGTRIATAGGDTAVEDLRVGDNVVCIEAGQRVLQPVRWIGTRRIDLAAHPDPGQAAPIRVRRGAFADALPQRDLVLSPDHCLFVDGGLIPVRLLVNGMSIVQDRQARAVQYWHVELDRHGVLLAEGLPAESYLDTGNRCFFRDAGPALTLHPSFRIAAGDARWTTDACAPLTVDEAAVRPVWQRLAARAHALGHVPPPEEAPAGEPDLHLVVEGRRIRAVAADRDCHVFVLPPGATRMEIVSHAARPSDRAPWLDDRRRLGLPVTRIVLRTGADCVVLSPDHPALQQGWHAAEHDESTLWRWTDGRAAVTLPAHAAGGMIAELHVRAAA